jgi:Dyp-type peroxidase family
LAYFSFYLKTNNIMPINQFDLKNRPLLDGIQGNILKSHGRSHTANLFISGKNGKTGEVKKWLKSLVEGDDAIIKSGYSQLRSNQLWKTEKVDSGIFACIHISAKGYEYLALDKDKLKSNTFGKGMAKAGLKDPLPVKWDKGVTDDAHFMLLIADGKEANVKAKALEIQGDINAFATVDATVFGNAVRNSEGAGIEHFGYVDGISQPLFFEDEIVNYKEENNIKGKTFKFNPSFESDLVLVSDPFAKGKNNQGSFFVFRKLEQDVKGFKKAEEELANALGLTGEAKELAGAMLVGRFEDGTPVQVSHEAGIINSAVFNNFQYPKDDFSKCPYHAHIRKTNPRSELDDAKVRTMARRGIPYGTRTDDPNDGKIFNKPKGEVGLLFMSYQASIETQFEVIQKFWANDPNFLKNDTGIDPIIGQGGFPANGHYDINGTKKDATFDQFVHMKGGGYFFAPSMEFLKNV